MPEVKEAVQTDGTKIEVGDCGSVSIRPGKSYMLKTILVNQSDGKVWALKVRQLNSRGRDMVISLDQFVLDKEFKEQTGDITLQPLPPEMAQRIAQADEEVRNKKFGKHGDTPTDHSG